jgi:hypothetical protein
MELGIQRRFFKPNYTVGRFYIDSQYFCDTLEDKVRDLKDNNKDGDFTDPGEGKIMKETAIPAGRYKVGIAWWPKHHKDVPILYGVPGFTGILIHSGVTQKDTEGCILVGKNTKIGQLENGPYYALQITQKIQEAIKNKEEVFITIQ